MARVGKEKNKKKGESLSKSNIFRAKSEKKTMIIN